MRSPFLALFLIPALANAAAQDIHVRVDPNGPGSISSLTDYTSIQQALDHHPYPTHALDTPLPRVIIEIVPGTYHERIIVTQNHPNITLLGLGKSPADVVITNSLNAKTAGGTFFTETAEINGDGFEADNLTFANTAGPTGQAVAAAVRSDRAIFKHVRFLGDQDTLFADFGRQYYLDCYIEGGVDFIFGNATAVFDHSEIHILRPGFLTAQSNASPYTNTGYLITDSRVTSSIATPPTADPTKPVRSGFFLGRPWRANSSVIVMRTELPADLDPAGWSKWKPDEPTPTANYAEYDNTGPGFRPRQRVPWSRQLSPIEANRITPSNFLRGYGSLMWNPITEAAKLP